MDSSAHSNARPSKALIALTTALMISHSALAADGPFGIPQGADIATLPACRGVADQPGMYVCKSVPSPHPDLKNYMVQAFPGIGVCWVRGGSGPIPSDAFGNALRSSLDDLKAQLSTVYTGGVDRHDLVIGGSMWAKPEYWMMGLLKNERWYKYEWSEKAGSKMKNGIERIAAYAVAARSDVGIVVLEYFFSNHAECQKAAGTVKAKSL